jgi:hypothetical protein
MFAYAATVIVTLALIVTIEIPTGRDFAELFAKLPFFPDVRAGEWPALPWRLILIAGLLFVTRDMALFLVFNFSPRPRRADFFAVLWLVILYGILPSVVSGLHLTQLLPAFLALPAAPPILGPVYPAAEAGILIMIALTRLFAMSKEPPGD